MLASRDFFRWFSILFNKQFCTFPTKKSSARMVDILEKLGLLDRIFSLDFKLDSAIDYEMVERKMSELRRESILFLENALMNEEDYERK